MNVYPSMYIPILIVVHDESRIYIYSEDSMLLGLTKYYRETAKALLK